MSTVPSRMARPTALPYKLKATVYRKKITNIVGCVFHFVFFCNDVHGQILSVTVDTFFSHVIFFYFLYLYY